MEVEGVRHLVQPPEVVGQEVVDALELLQLEPEILVRTHPQKVSLEQLI
jgi:hypothetical protein